MAVMRVAAIQLIGDDFYGRKWLFYYRLFEEEI